MNIRYAILGFLSWKPLSGYDLKKMFVESVFIYWSGNNNQIYKELIQLTREEMVTNEIKNYRIASNPVRDNTGNVIAAIEMVEDITEKLRMETELLKLEKLESRGVVAGAIARNFNKILLSLIWQYFPCQERISERFLFA